MTNFTRLRKMTKSELAEELTRIQTSGELQYVDFREWLESSDSTLLPHGRKVLADIIIRNNATRDIAFRKTIECIIISDNETFFGQRYYRIYDLTDNKIKSVCFDSIEVIDI